MYKTIFFQIEIFLVRFNNKKWAMFISKLCINSSIAFNY
jgi:hypothetical protein